MITLVSPHAIRWSVGRRILSYIVYGAEADGLGHLLSEKDLQKFYEAQLDLGYAMLKKAGFDRAMSYEEIIEAIK